MSLGELTKIYWWILYVSAGGQLLFIATWATLPFWRSWVGRALMVKSFALGVVLWTQIYFHFREPQDMRRAFEIAITVLGLMAIGIWSQVIAILYEVWQGRKLLRTIEAERNCSVDPHGRSFD